MTSSRLRILTEILCPLIAVPGFDHDRPADLLGGGPGVFSIGHRPAVGTATPAACRSFLVSSLSWAMASGDGAAHVGFGGLDATLCYPSRIEPGCLR